MDKVTLTLHGKFSRWTTSTTGGRPFKRPNCSQNQHKFASGRNNHKHISALTSIDVLTCFFCQVYRNTIDHTIEMHDKLLSRVFALAQENIDAASRNQRRMIRSSLLSFQRLGRLILDQSIRKQSYGNCSSEKSTADKLKGRASAGLFISTFSYPYTQIIAEKRRAYVPLVYSWQWVAMLRC